MREMHESMDAEGGRRAWIEFLRLERRLSPRTLDAYGRDAAAFLDFLRDHLGGEPSLKDLGALAPRDLRAYLAFRRKGELALGDRSIARAMAAIRSFLTFLERRYGVGDARLSLVRGPRLKPLLPRPVTEEAARAALDSAASQAGEPWIAARDAAVLTLLYGAGLRISEALSIKFGEAPLEDSLRVVGKGGKARVVPIIAAAREATARYAALCPFALGADRRPAQPAHRAGVDGARARRARTGAIGDAARFAPRIRYASARARRRSARDPGIARPRITLHDAALHRCRKRAARRFIPRCASPRAGKKLRKISLLKGFDATKPRLKYSSRKNTVFVRV
jgi:integrase/recombinase XerC